MADIEFIVSIPMPFQGESIVDGVLVSWLVEVGQEIRRGQPIAEIETEKSVWEFESPGAGTVVRLMAEEGDIVDVGAPLLEVRSSDEDLRHLSAAPDTAEQMIRDAETAVQAPSLPSTGGLSLSPRLKKIIKDNGISDADLTAIHGTGPEGRLTAEDIQAYLDLRSKKDAPAAAIGPAPVSESKTCWIAGLGVYAPPRIIDNKIFEEFFPDIDEQYIEKVTGIKQRRWVEDETTSDLAYNAAVRAIDNAGIRACDIDLIILATTTPDMPLPATACAIQSRLGCLNIPAFDLAAACSGWLYGLSIARQFILNGTYTNILVVSAETMSTFTDKTDRATAFLFGDGAGAAVLSSALEGHVLSDVLMEADGSGYDIIYRKGGGSANPPGGDWEVGDAFWFMDGGRMFRGAVDSFSKIIEDVCSREKVAPSQITWYVPHQANHRILKSVAHKIKADFSRFYSNIHRYGNTSAASIPLALIDLEAEHGIEKGDTLLLCAVGAGLTSAGCLIRW